MMRAASRAALDHLRRRYEHTGVTADELRTLGGELYQVAATLVAQPRLRRTLADPSTPPEGRAQLVGSLLRGKVGEPAVELVRDAVSQRWSSPWDLVDALELAGDDALLASAEQQGALDEVEDELFRFERILEGESQLATLFDELSVPAQRRVELLRRVLDGKVQPATLAVLEHTVASSRKRSIELAIDELLEAAAARQSRSVARVISATPLTDQQESRLAAALERIYGRRIAVRSAVEPAVQGGLVIRVGDEVIDGSVASRFAAARRALAGTGT